MTAEDRAKVDVASRPAGVDGDEQPSLRPRARSAAALRPTVAEIDLGAIAHNVRAVRAFLDAAASPAAPAPALWAVVKADGYGHGAAEVAATMLRAGAAGLCVALVEEGLELRAAGVRAPVLVMSGVYRVSLGEALAAGLVPVVHDPSQLETLARWDADAYGPARVHLKLDTGMSRVGITEDAWEPVASRLAALPGVRVDGVMTHFASADEDERSVTEEQLVRFARARAVLRAAGLAPSCAHAANSAGAFRFPAARLDLVRPGIALYGIAPFAHDGPALLPALRLRTEVLALRTLPAGTPVGYGGTWRAPKRCVLATVPIGYADGFFRRLSSGAEALLRGRRVRVVGNVSMDMATLDVTEVAAREGVQVGDEVVLLGAQRAGAVGASIRAEEIAARVGTLAYEVLTAVSRRVPRVYLDAPARPRGALP